MSWLSVFFKKDSVKAILKAGEAILKILIGQAASNLQSVAQEEVAKAEATGATGAKKYEMAFAGVRARFPQMREAFINHAIETAVLALLAANK